MLRHQKLWLSPITSALLVTVLISVTACSQKYSSPSDSFEIATGLHTASLSTQSTYTISGSTAHGVSLWRVEDKERLYDWNHAQGVDTTLFAADFSADGTWALTADRQTLSLWALKDGQSARYWSAPAPILDAKLSGDARFALLGLDNHEAVLFDIQRGGVLRTFKHANRVRSVSISSDNKIALTGSEDSSAIAWDLKNGKALHKKQHQDDVQLVRLSPDGSLALSVSKYDKAIVWRTQDGETVLDMPLEAEALKRGLRFTTARFSEDNLWLLTGRPDEVVTLWDIQAQKQKKTWRVPKRHAWKPSGANILDVSFAPEDGVFYAVASSGHVHQLKLMDDRQ